MNTILLALITLVAAPAVSWTVPPPTLGTVELTVTDARSDDGRVVALLFSSSDGFPVDVDKAAYTATGAIRGGRATITVPGVRAGRYSVVVFHDADGDGRIKRNFLGMPREGIGVTRFDGGRPRFGSTAVEVPASGAQYTIGLNYR